jgi:O-antigen/teichoic acid export membrane protein
LIYAVLVKFLWELDALLVPRIFGIAQMAFYWAGQRLAYAWKGFLWAGIWPAVPEATEESDQTSVRLQKIHWMQVTLAIPMAATLLYYSSDIVRIWTSQENRSAVLVLRLLTVAVLIDFFPATYISVFFARARVGMLAKLLSVGVIVKMIVALFAWYRQDFRLMIFSTTAGAVIFSILVFFSASERKMAQLVEFWKPALPALAGTLTGSFLFSIARFRPANWSEMVALAAAFFLVCLCFTAILMAVLLRREKKSLSWLWSGNEDFGRHLHL